ncbi:TrmH family RNA methyltransferase [Leucobacter sp. USHLN153]|uniref:TrmH family RNA methyltransferase n=1 Tax=Leucobacter sp. USHLN153 TaxID=3081268 RepID=UPI003015EE1C
MNDEILSNPKSERVRRISSLARKKDRQAHGRFLVEGPQSVRELLAYRAELVETVYTTLGTEPWQREIDRLASDAGVRIERATPEVIAAMAETVHPQGVIAVARMWEADVAEVLAGARLVAILHEIRDPGNAGTVLRAADAAGADAVIFAGASIDPFHPKVVRSTTGSLFHLPVAVAESLETAVDAAQRAGLVTLAADVRGADLLEARAEGTLAGPVAWVFGNEARGLTEEDRALVGRSIKLPIYGAAESLNLATAASVLLYETAFAQRA